MRRRRRVGLVRGWSWMRTATNAFLRTLLDPKLLTFSDSSVWRLSLANQEHLVRTCSQWPGSGARIFENNKAKFNCIVTVLTTTKELPRSFFHGQRIPIHIAWIDSNPIVRFWVALVKVDFNCFPFAIAVVVCVNDIVTIRMGYWLADWVRCRLTSWLWRGLRSRL